MEIFWFYKSSEDGKLKYCLNSGLPWVPLALLAYGGPNPFASQARMLALNSGQQARAWYGDITFLKN
jgi:hypothetical protein